MLTAVWLRRSHSAGGGGGCELMMVKSLSRFSTKLAPEALGLRHRDSLAGGSLGNFGRLAIPVVGPVRWHPLGSASQYVFGTDTACPSWDSARWPEPARPTTRGRSNEDRMSVNSTAPWLRESYSRDDGRRPKTVVAAAVALVATAGVNGIVTAFNIASLLGQGFDKSSLSLLITVAVVGALVAVGVPLWIARAALRGSVGARFWSIFFLVALFLLTIQGSNPWSYIGCLLALGSLVLLWMPASRRFCELGRSQSR